MAAEGAQPGKQIKGGGSGYKGIGLTVAEEQLRHSEAGQTEEDREVVAGPQWQRKSQTPQSDGERYASNRTDCLIRVNGVPAKQLVADAEGLEVHEDIEALLDIDVLESRHIKAVEVRGHRREGNR